MRPGFFPECQLTQLSRDFGKIGLLGGQPTPGVVAEIDQHAAAIRDSIECDGIRLTRQSLTHYLNGFLDGVLERGWHSSDTDYDWETLRLMAICWLAQEYGFVR